MFSWCNTRPFSSSTRDEIFPVSGCQISICGPLRLSVLTVPVLVRVMQVARDLRNICARGRKNVSMRKVIMAIAMPIMVREFPSDRDMVYRKWSIQKGGKEMDVSSKNSMDKFFLLYPILAGT